MVRKNVRKKAKRKVKAKWVILVNGKIKRTKYRTKTIARNAAQKVADKFPRKRVEIGKLK